MEHEPYLIS